MVKRLQHSIDQAIQTVIDDVPANEITNWCENIRTSQVGQSMVGEMVDLPIGPKEISCTKVDSRMGGMTYKGAAEFFVESNCVDCPYHVLVGSPNIGQGIVDEVRKRLKVQEVDEQAQEELRKLVVPGIDVDAILAGDAETDEHVRSLVGLLADDERKADAAAKLVTVSEQFPQLISPSVAEVMTGAFSDRQIGGSVIQAISKIVDIKPSIWPRVIDAAKLALRSFSNAEQIGTN